MNKIMRVVLIGVSLCVWSCIAYGQGVTKEQIKGLDEQVQEIKSDVLSIAAELNQLEEKLLYPSDTQISIFMAVAKNEKFRLDSVDILLDGKLVAQHLYTFKELEALQMGGVQRIFTGNIRTGGHQVEVSYRGKSTGGNDLEHMESFKVQKDVGPSIVEITLNHQGITLKDR